MRPRKAGEAEPELEFDMSNPLQGRKRKRRRAIPSAKPDAAIVRRTPLTASGGVPISCHRPKGSARPSHRVAPTLRSGILPIFRTFRLCRPHQPAGKKPGKILLDVICRCGYEDDLTLAECALCKEFMAR